MSFHVGQKVTMRQRIPPGFKADPSTVLPGFGRVYTVRAVDFWSGEEWIRFCEIRNPDVVGHGKLIEPWFASCCFRPVVERKTDISVFTAMLDSVKQGEPA